MNRTYWTKKLREAEAELDAATKPSEIRAAGRKLRLVKEELRRLGHELGVERQGSKEPP